MLHINLGQIGPELVAMVTFRSHIHFNGFSYFSETTRHTALIFGMWQYKIQDTRYKNFYLTSVFI